MRSTPLAVLLGCLCISGLAGASGAVAQPAGQTQSPSGVPYERSSADPVSQLRQQSEIRRRIADQQLIKNSIDEDSRFALRARQEGDCVEFERRILILAERYTEEFIQERVRSIRAPFNPPGRGLPPSQRRELLQYVKIRLSTLRRLDCPPRTATPTQQTASATNNLQLQFGPGVSTTYGLTTRNGGLGREHSVSEPSFEVMMRSGGWGAIPGGEPSLEARLFGGSGSSTHNQGNVFGGVLNQWNGGTQDTSGAGNATNVRSSAEITHVGAEVVYGIEYAWRPPWAGTQSGTARFYAGVKYEHWRLKTGLFARWQAIDFNVNSTSVVEVDRGSVFVGWRGKIAEILGMDAFVEGRLGVNGDTVTGSGVYTSDQFGSPLGPAANGSDSKSAFTFGGSVGAGLARTLTNGTKFEAKAFVGTEPVWQLTAHNGRPATLEHENKLTVGAGGFIVIQTNPPDGPPRVPEYNLERRWREIR